jgi:hypothetical protein
VPQPQVPVILAGWMAEPQRAPARRIARGRYFWL